jgi:hypothetical protein
MSILGPYGYQGGLNTDASLITLPKGQLFELQNMIVNQGQLLPIPGYNTASIPQPPVAGTGTYYFQSLLSCEIAGNNYLFIPFIGNGTTPIKGCFFLENLTGSWSSDIGNSIFPVAFDGSYCIEVMNGVVTIGGQDAIAGGGLSSGGSVQWTGSGNVTAGIGTGIIKQVNNFMFALFADGTLDWSNVGDSTTYPAGNSLTFRYKDGDQGVALGKIGNTLYIFKLNSIGALSTQSVVISGAVVLGPLYTVFDKVGTFSMRSLDNLPTGEIVFMGTDYNLYKFDGSNLINLSNRPYPQSSIQGAIYNFLNSNTTIATSNLLVRVNPLQNAIYVVFGGQNNFGTETALMSWAYDYVQDYWYQPTTTFMDFCYLNTIGTLNGIIPSAVNGLFLGISTNGNSIYSLSSSYTTFNGNPIVGNSAVSIPYTFESRDIIPRSVILAFTANSSDTMTFQGGLDSSYTSSISPTPTGSLQKSILPINFSDSKTTIQVQLQPTSSHAYSINPIAIDTEIGQ